MRTDTREKPLGLSVLLLTREASAWWQEEMVSRSQIANADQNQ